MRRPLAALALTLVLVASPARADGTDAGNYHVAFVRPGAGGYNHGFTQVAAFGTKVLVGSPAEISSADVYDARIGATEHHFPSFYGLDESSFGIGVAASSRGYLIGEASQREAYLFDRRFRLRLTLKPPADGLSRAFGTAVGETHRTIIVGDPSGEASYPEPTGPGAAFLFNNRTGERLRKLTSPTPDRGGGYGRAVVGCAGGFAVAQPGDYYKPGAVHVYDREGELVQTLQAPTPLPRDMYGTALAAAGIRLLIGAPGPFGTPGNAYLYERRRGAFTLVRTFTAEGVLLNGIAVALRGTRAVLGGSNTVTVFDADAGTRLATLGLPLPAMPDIDTDYVPYLPWTGLGISVAIVGKTILAGTTGDDENAGSIAVGFAPNAPAPPECAAQYPCY
jgi:hypothetical protein